MPILSLNILFLLLAINYDVYSQENWILKKEIEGIKVYTRHSEVSKFNEVKAEFSIKSSASIFTSIILDVDKFADWVYGTKSAMLVKKISDEELIYYSEFKAPWPVSNRDFYSNLKVHQDTIKKMITIESKSIPDYDATKKGIVRIPFSTTNWTIKIIDNETLKVVYRLSIDPGGKIPAWVVNLFSANGPAESFIKLRKRCK